MESTLHKQLIKRAESDGWIRMERSVSGDWRAAFARTIRQPRWSGEAEELGDVIKSKVLHPDAWRINVEGADTGRWNYDVLVLEFLEVEVTGKMSADKKRAYERLWLAFDSTALLAFRVFHMDRFGVVRPFLTDGTIHTWRASAI
jgi:hypothetical protein